MIGPPGLTGSRVLALVLGISGDATERGAPGNRPKLREGERREWSIDKEGEAEGKREWLNTIARGQKTLHCTCSY